MAADSAGTVVLVHGGFVDGSGWQGVYDHLKKDGYNVSIVQNPTVSHADDVAVTKRVIDEQSEPVILVGHSYGGAVITEAGNHPKVEALVYIAAFAPDKDESVNTLIANPPPDAPVPPILAPQEGFLFLDREKFHDSFAGDLSDEQAEFMADSQVPWGVDALGGTISDPAWRSKPSWYLVATEDRMIPPPAQRQMSERAGSTVVEVEGSHAIYLSQPAAVAELIETAATEVSSARTNLDKHQRPARCPDLEAAGRSSCERRAGPLPRLAVFGVPLTAAAAGWLFAGREPPAIARPAIE
jgi:pimeloyl-ACP methyl ester carboxylesterase